MEHRRRVRPLSDRDRGVLDIERTWGGAPGAQQSKFEQAWDSLGLNAHAYSLILSGLVNDPAAAEFAPDVIDRLRHRRTDPFAERNTAS